MRREKSLGGLYKHVSGMLNINLTLRGGRGLACDIWRMHKSPHSQLRVTASSVTADLACYGYIKRSTVIDKLSLRLGEGGSCVNIIITLSVTLTPL